MEEEKNDYYINQIMLSRENLRHSTYQSFRFSKKLKKNLSKAGFYNIFSNKNKCFSCLVEFSFDFNNESLMSFSFNDFVKYHKKLKPDCLFINGHLNNTFDDEDNENKRRVFKKFYRYINLIYESERLATFIEWPLSYILPKDLAANGFYYLRTSDHCACIFCDIVVGAWEITDTPLGEHRKHSPSCPFLKEKVILNNIPLEHCQILEELVLDGEECVIPLFAKTFITLTNSSTNITTAITTTTIDDIANNLGVNKYSEPARKEFITEESRLQSFTNNGRKWPERLNQKPEELAVAGFFYNG